MFLLHPLLGWLSIFFVVILVLLAMFSQSAVGQSRRGCAKAEVDGQQYLFSKLRNAEVSSPMGMLATCAGAGPIGTRSFMRRSDAGAGREPSA